MKKFLYRLLMVICAAVFCFSAWKLYEIWNTTQIIKNETSDVEQFIKTDKDPMQDPAESGEDPSENQTFTVDWEAMKAQNQHIVGWIMVPGTNISYPVVQGDDNVYYLDHSIKGENIRQGSIFLDADAPSDFSADNSLVYGHSVDIGGMFTDLRKFEDKAFFDSHPYFWLLTPEQNYKAEIFTLALINDAGAAYTTDFGDYEETVVDTMVQEALYSRDVERSNRKMISLSTCNLDYGYHSDQRIVLTAVLKPYYHDDIQSED